MIARHAAACLVLAALFSACGGADGDVLLLASTTSTEDTGLLDALIPTFEDESGYTVKLISGGSGQALETARRGDVDVLLVHSPDAEKEFVASGDGIERALVMYNDFVLAGPPDDPAGVRAAGGISPALQAIAARSAAFISRGDDSGTHMMELKQWRAAGIEPAGEPWYAESGQGQGATLQLASDRSTYALTDRGTFLVRRDGLDLDLLVEGDEALRNYYHVIVVNPDRHDTNVDAARAFAAYITGTAGQEIIRAFGVAEFGEPIFFAAAGMPDPTE